MRIVPSWDARSPFRPPSEDAPGLTRAELTERVYRRQASVSDIENGKMTVDADTLARLALALSKPISYFFPEWLMERLQPE
jgi:transcriptional regulator with XRE-family HTH domain